MVNFCAVFGCSNRCNREKDKSFFRIPKIVLHGDEEMRALSIERKREWVSMIYRKDTDLTASRIVCAQIILYQVLFLITCEFQSFFLGPRLN